MIILAASLPGMQQSESHLTGIRYRRILIRSFFILLLLLPIVAVSAQTMEEADRLYNKGDIRYSQERYTEALEKLSGAAQIYLNLGADKDYMSSLYYSGECLLMLGNYEAALETYLLALPLTEKVGSRNEKALIQNQIGLTYFHLQNYEMALNYSYDVLRYYTKVGDLQEEARVNGDIADILKNADRLDEALVIYLETISLYEQLSDYEEVSRFVKRAGFTYYNLGQFHEAADCFERAAGIYVDLGSKSLEIDMMYHHGVMLTEAGDIDEAREILQSTLVLQKEFQNYDGISATMVRLGEIEELLGNFRSAIGFYEGAYEIDKRDAHPVDLVSSSNHLGTIYMFWGRYDEALKFYEESLEISKTIDNPYNVAVNLSNIGLLYSNWGQDDKALEFFKEALAIQRQLTSKIGLASVLANIGSHFASTGQLEKSLQYTEEAITIYEDFGNHRGVSLLKNNIGNIYSMMGDSEAAIRYFKQSLELSEINGFRDITATVYGNLGTVYTDWLADDEAAIGYYKKALALYEELGMRNPASIALGRIGAIYEGMEDYDNAIDFLNRDIEIKEILRITAEGSIRRDYLASVIHTYQFLCSIHIKNGNPAKAFETAELSAAKYLVDQLSEGLDKSILSTVPIETYLKRATDDSLVISFANVIDDEEIARFNADKNHIEALELPLKSFLDTINDKHGSRISEDLFYLDLKDQLDESGTATFEDIINYYRYLLTAYNLGSDEKEIRYDIETALYNCLFSGLEEILAEKDELLIIPGGILAFLPFEALRMPDDRYLVERFNIRYAQSLSVLNILESRRYNSNTKEPLLAFGGAVYNQQSYEKSIVESGNQLEAVMQSTMRDLDRGLNVGETYQMLGVGNWDNLPGTIAEVQAIGSIVPESTIYTGERVNEAFVKSLSTHGVLKDYRVLHFATHGLVVPEIPELSAVVLSLTDDTDTEDDGYLRMGEIAALEIEADFVNLSACETGLGKIYGGEGVVGLTQSFLVAGANGLSVSLWQVSDESTMEFMIGVYQLVNEQGLTYDLAMTEMKRRFIAGGQYSEPFYWAPFVYYGK